MELGSEDVSNPLSLFGAFYVSTIEAPGGSPGPSSRPFGARVTSRARLVVSGIYVSAMWSTGYRTMPVKARMSLEWAPVEVVRRALTQQSQALTSSRASWTTFSACVSSRA